MSDPLCLDCILTASGTASSAVRVNGSARLVDNILSGGTQDVLIQNSSTAQVEGNVLATSTLEGTGALVPYYGDRSAFDALNYRTHHANDIDDAVTSIHHTLGNAADQAAPGDHTHIISPGDITLTDTHILVGNGSNVAADVAMSNDATIANTGALTLANTAVTPGDYISTNLTVDSKGRITAAANGLAGAINAYNEIQTGTGGATYYLANEAEPDTVRAYVNGIRQPAENGASASDIVTFSVAPDAGDTLIFDYELAVT